MSTHMESSLHVLKTHIDLKCCFHRETIAQRSEFAWLNPLEEQAEITPEQRMRPAFLHTLSI